MIPVIDVDLNGAEAWREAFLPHRKSIHALLGALDAQATEQVVPAAWWGLKRVSGAANALWGSLYGDECTELAEAAGRDARDILVGNLAYDLSHVGCSTLAIPPGTQTPARCWPGTWTGRSASEGC